MVVMGGCLKKCDGDIWLTVEGHRAARLKGDAALNMGPMVPTLGTAEQAGQLMRSATDHDRRSYSQQDLAQGACAGVWQAGAKLFATRSHARQYPAKTPLHDAVRRPGWREPDGCRSS